MINTEKSDFEPKRTGEWLGTFIDTFNMTFKVPTVKVEKLKADLSYLVCHNRVTARKLASTAGKLSAMHLAIGPIVRLQTRSIYADITSAPSWDQPCTVSDSSIEELKFWLNHYNFEDGYSFKLRPVTTKILFTDASEFGYGGFEARRMGETLVRGRFSRIESKLPQHSGNFLQSST